MLSVPIPAHLIGQWRTRSRHAVQRCSPEQLGPVSCEDAHHPLRIMHIGEGGTGEGNLHKFRRKMLLETTTCQPEG
eukprot:1155539-Amphidinium_carterae.1